VEYKTGCVSVLSLLASRTTPSPSAVPDSTPEEQKAARYLWNVSLAVAAAHLGCNGQRAMRGSERFRLMELSYVLSSLHTKGRRVLGIPVIGHSAEWTS